MDSGALRGRRVLILEDEFLIAMDVEQLCREHGADQVAIVRNIAETEASGFGLEEFDVAIIDVMVDGRSSLDFAGRLRDSRVPFIFASGYPEEDGVFAGFPGIAVVAKPYAGQKLIGAIVEALTESRSG